MVLKGGVPGLAKIIGILVALLVLTACICLHELGHMAVARKFGVGVVEYSVGMGKLLWSRRKGDTVYSVRMIPLGGYCAMYGEQSMEAEGKGEAEAAPAPKGKQPDYKTDWRPEQALSRAPIWQRVLIYVAGPGMNFLLGLAACVVLVSTTTFASVPVVHEIIPGHPAEQQDVRVGDIVAGANGQRFLTWSDYQEWSATHPHVKETGWDLTMFRDGEYITVRATVDEEDGLFGYRVRFEPVAMTADRFLLYVADAFSYMGRSVIDSFGMLARGDAKVSDLSGVIGITNAVGESVEESAESIREHVPEDGEEFDPAMALAASVYTTAVFMLALISVNLGIMNLIPIPALDGGRVLFCGIEALIRRPIPERVEYTVNAVSMILVLVLMGYVCVNDLWRILLSGAGI